MRSDRVSGRKTNRKNKKLTNRSKRTRVKRSKKSKSSRKQHRRKRTKRRRTKRRRLNMRGGADEADGPPSDVGAQVTAGPPSDLGAQLTAEVAEKAKVLVDAIEAEDWPKALELAQKYPAYARVEDEDGYLPLYLAVEDWDEPGEWGTRLNLVDVLIEAYPGALIIKAGRHGRTALWAAVWYGAPLAMVEKLAEAGPQALTIKCGARGGRTPLEVAKESPGKIAGGVYQYLKRETDAVGSDGEGPDKVESALKLKARLEATESPWSVPFAKAMGLQMRLIINKNPGRGITLNLWKDLFEGLTDEEKHFAKNMKESHNNKGFAKRATAPLVKILEAHIKPKDTPLPTRNWSGLRVDVDFGGSQTYDAREEVSSTTDIETKKVSSTTGTELSAGAPRERMIDFFLDRILLI